MVYDSDKMNGDYNHRIENYDDYSEYLESLYPSRRHKETPRKRKFINSNWDDRHPIIKALYALNYFL